VSVRKRKEVQEVLRGGSRPRWNASRPDLAHPQEVAANPSVTVRFEALRCLGFPPPWEGGRCVAADLEIRFTHSAFDDETLTRNVVHAALRYVLVSLFDLRASRCSRKVGVEPFCGHQHASPG
jgi:hypothetical protein